MPRFAAIDIGSNAMRLRIVEVNEPSESPVAPARYRAEPVGTEVVSMRAPVRLGREVFLTGSLAPAAVSAAVDALRGFRQAMDEAKVDLYQATATSAVREAKNGHVLVDRAAREAGVHVEVIEGVEEARLVQLAVRRKLRLDDCRALLVDIGGGSTELTLVDRGELRASQSLPVGTVRLLEAFYDGEAKADARRANLVRDFLTRVFEELSDEIAEADVDVVVATGGNIDTLATLCPDRSEWGQGVDVSAMKRLVAEIATMPTSERARRYGLRPDRADTIVPAARILLHVAEPRRTTLVAPGTGLKEGILESLIDRHFVRADAGEDQALVRACIRLGRRYSFDEAHGTHVAELAAQLFDDLEQRHGMKKRERLLLRAAAILHDVGDFVRYEGHHKHSGYIIEHSDLMGLSPTEHKVVANVARYHRKSFPDPAHPSFRDLSRDDRATVRGLAAILRLADALDREHRRKVKQVRARITNGAVELAVSGEAERDLEDWTLARKAELFRAVYDLDVTIAGEASRPPRSAPPRVEDPGE